MYPMQTKLAPTLLGRYIAALGLIVSGVIHLALVSEHLREAPILGLGFVGVGVAQLGLGALFARRRAADLWPAALILTVFSITVYLISRTAGLPFGHDQAPETVAPVDLVSKGAEALTALVLLANIHTTTRGWPRGRSLRLAPFSRFAYLLMLMCMGAVFALVAIDVGSALAPHGGEHGGMAARVPLFRTAPATSGRFLKVLPGPGRALP